jgi:hypothetical protein
MFSTMFNSFTSTSSKTFLHGEEPANHTSDGKQPRPKLGVYMDQIGLDLAKTKTRTIYGTPDWVEQNNHPL